MEHYLVEFKHDADECPAANAEWDKMKADQRVSLLGDAGFCLCPFGDHSGFVVVAGRKAVDVVAATLTTGESTHRRIEVVPYGPAFEAA